MNTYYTIDFSLPSRSVVALGCFDGVHVAHARVIAEAKKKADELSCKCVVWTFDTPPKNFFLPTPVPLLTDAEQKKDAIRALGADILVSVPFDKRTSEISPESFFDEIIIKRLNACHIVCGFDYAFGKSGKGNVEMLQSLCSAGGIGLSVIPEVLQNGVTVSSSAIREFLLNGMPEKAASLLGRPYALRSNVINGQHLARRLGFPTVNQQIPSGMLIPQYGVYVSEILTDRSAKKLYGITNVGIRPTVGGNTPYVETHIFDFSGDLYGTEIQVGFLAFLRPERKFGSTDDLSTQVKHDIEAAKKFIKTI
ncbi:MAG: bifunctional riboflavin kinase/FAD synthetase [Ruminococcaceae bacterium]|nr:bifunctional riboflavin kinase/FAD synthetase [Oscillospiraceae bacterium]